MQNIILCDDAQFFGSGDLYGGVSYSQDINPDSNLQYGIVSIPEIEFVIDWDKRSRLGSGTLIWSLKMVEETQYRTMGTYIVDTVTKEKNKAKVKSIWQRYLIRCLC